LSPEQRLDELETRLSFQDHTVHQLNDALTDQQRQIDQLHAQIDRLRQQLETVSAALPAQAAEDEVPPHY
jgi:SlyX protein